MIFGKFKDKTIIRSKFYRWEKYFLLLLLTFRFYIQSFPLSSYNIQKRYSHDVHSHAWLIWWWHHYKAQRSEKISSRLLFLLLPQIWLFTLVRVVSSDPPQTPPPPHTHPAVTFHTSWHVSRGQNRTGILLKRTIGLRPTAKRSFTIFP